VPEALRFVSDYRYIVYGIILVLMMIFRPQGVIDQALLDRVARGGSPGGS
jgi:branched-chain amino acid transport system permease protein